MTNKPGLSERDVRKWKGHPVCVVMKNGSYYVGVIEKVENGSVLFAGRKGRKKFDSAAFRQADRARVSGFFPGMMNPFGAGWGMNAGGSNAGLGGLMSGFGQNAGFGQGAGAGGLGGLMGTFQKAWPGIKMGIGMMKTIMPLLGGLKI